MEELCSYTDEELVEQGADIAAIEDARAEVDAMYNMTNKELKKVYGMDEVESMLFKDAVESGKKILAGDKRVAQKNTECLVTASGSITSSEMEYTQTVTNKSTKKKPIYDVVISYTWKSVYSLAIFDDEIVVGWGGGLNLSNASGTAKYYEWKKCGEEFGSYYKKKNMSIEETIQAGVEFIFPQSISGKHWYSNLPKTKSGSCKFTISQTKKQGYESKIISRYCHRVIAIKGFGIGIDSSGVANVSLDIGSAWDKTSQKSSKINY